MILIIERKGFPKGEKDLANVVVLAGHYYPFYSANGSIMKNLIDELKTEHEIIVIAVKNNFELSDYEEYDGYNIIRLNEFATCFHNFCERKKHSAKGLKKNIFNFLLQSKRVLLLLKKVLKKESLDQSLVKKHYNSLQRLNENFPIDVILPVSLPFESFVAAAKFKKTYPNVKVLPFQLDHFSESETLHNSSFIKKLRYKKHIEIEKDCIKNSDHFYILPQLKEHYGDKEFIHFHEKITVCEHPLIKAKVVTELNTIKFRDNCINLVYAGSLYKDIRSPKYILDILTYIPSNENICFNVFHFGNCNEILEDFKDRLGVSLQNYGQVPAEISLSAMNDSDILISIANNINNQVPSKIFDYLSFGKPIIHLYQDDSDPYLNLLKEYPLALCVKMDNEKIKDNALKIQEFCKSNSGNIISFDEVQKKYFYATPSFVASKFSEEFI